MRPAVLDPEDDAGGSRRASAAVPRAGPRPAPGSPAPRAARRRASRTRSAQRAMRSPWKGGSSSLRLRMCFGAVGEDQRVRADDRLEQPGRPAPGEALLVGEDLLVRRSVGAAHQARPVGQQAQREDGPVPPARPRAPRAGPARSGRSAPSGSRAPRAEPRRIPARLTFCCGVTCGRRRSGRPRAARWRRRPSARPSTSRVSRGSITPSSQSRAVAKYGWPWRSYWSRSDAPTSGWPTVSMTVAACSPPITEMRALGHMNRKRGEYARPHMP